MKLLKCYSGILLLFLLFPSLYAQTCAKAQRTNALIDQHLDAKLYDSIPFYISQLPTDDYGCYQSYLISKIKLALEIKEADSAFHYILQLHNSLETHGNVHYKMQENYLSGRYHYNLGYNDSASVYFIQALNLSKAQHDTTFQIKALNSLSTVFANLGQFDKAIQYCNSGLVLAVKKGDKSNEILLLGNLISYYGKQYLKTNEKKMLDSAESVSKKLVFEAKKQKNTYALLKAYSGLGSVYFQYENYQNTLGYSDSIIKLDKSGKYPKVLLQAYGNICDSYLALGKHELAKKAGDSTLRYALQLGNKTTIAEVYFKLYECEYGLKNYKNAIDFYKLHTANLDSAKAESQFSIVNELEQKYNKFENEKTISDLTKEKEINSLRIRILIIGIIGFTILVVLIIFVSRQRSLKQRNALLETEQRLNRARINPHFFFNSITTLQGLALKENDGKLIYTNLFKFAKLMRETLESSYSDLVSIDKEIQFISHYIELQKLNLKGKFSFEVELADDIESDDFLIPSMIIQPFIENAIEHGFSEMSSGGEIKLHFSKRNHELVIAISDNGKGMENSTTKLQEHVSRAMQITTDRLKLINSLHNLHARFQVLANTPKGTLVEIFLPLQLKDEGAGNR